MTYTNRLFNRIDRIEQALEVGKDVAGLAHAEDWVPPHKQAGLVPYDIILTFEESPKEIDEEDVEELLEEKAIPYDRVIVVQENDDPRYSGESAAYISMVEYKN